MMTIMYWKPERGRAQSSWLKGCYRRLAVSQGREGIRPGQRKKGLQVPKLYCVESYSTLVPESAMGWLALFTSWLKPLPLSPRFLKLWWESACRPCDWRECPILASTSHLLSNTSPFLSLHFPIRTRISGVLFVRSALWGKNMNTFRKSFSPNDYQ